MLRAFKGSRAKVTIGVDLLRRFLGLLPAPLASKSRPTIKRKTGGRRRPAVLVVANYRPDNHHSMLRFGDELVPNLRLLGLSVEAIRPPEIGDRLFGRWARLGKLPGYIDKFLLFPLILSFRASRANLVHIVDHSNALYRFVVWGRPVVITCHDTFAIRIMLGDVPGKSWGRLGRWMQQANLAGLRRNRWISCDSEETFRDLVRLVGSRPSVRVIPMALASAYSPVEADDKAECPRGLGVSEPFVLHVGGNGYYKNRPGVVDLFECLAAKTAFASLRLLLAGRAPDERLAETIAASPFKSRIEVLIDPDDETVVALYRRARLLLFPSLQEGFGWPIVEAQACGCPVVTTNAEPMRSVAGGAAILIDPSKPAEAADRITAALPELPRLVREGLANVENYRPDKVYHRYLDFYREALVKEQRRSTPGDSG